MEMTGQAFEDMQEQNARLLEQIKEKDDMNFKLMTEVALLIFQLFSLLIYLSKVMISYLFSIEH